MEKNASLRGIQNQGNQGKRFARNATQKTTRLPLEDRYTTASLVATVDSKDADANCYMHGLIHIPARPNTRLGCTPGSRFFGRIAV